MESSWDTERDFGEECGGVAVVGVWLCVGGLEWVYSGAAYG